MVQFPETKTVKDLIRDAIGQTVTFTIRGNVSACSVCSGANLYDSVNEVSLDPFCDVCSGMYWITQDTTSGVVAHVRWRSGDESDFGIAGETLIGDCSITVSVDDLPDSQIVKVKGVIADNRKLEIFRTIERGVPSRDRIRFICREVGKE